MINYHKRKFKLIVNSDNGETSSDTVFHYMQEGNILTASYSGRVIKKGHLIGLVDAKGNINMRYHQINMEGRLMTGICRSTPEIMANGKIRLHETWKWTSGDESEGSSIIEEI